MLVKEFDVYQQGYNEAEVTVYIAGTTDKATLYAEEDFTTELANPQTLVSKTDSGGNLYGRFLQSVYVNQPYYLDINRSEETGIQRPPLTSLDNQDASDATIKVEGSDTENSLKDIVARTIHVEDYGEIITSGDASSAATNTETITSAIGALGGSGEVLLPSGVIRFNQLSIAAGIVLRGNGETATTLQSIIGDNSITITGDGAGLQDLSLDGNAVTANSIGVYGVDIDNLIFRNVTIKNFETNLYLKGGSQIDWRNFSLENGTFGAKLHGDTDAGDTGSGSSFLGGIWSGGTVRDCPTVGVQISYVDEIASNLTIDNVLFLNNTGTAIQGVGCRSVALNHCRWEGNTTNFDIDDEGTVLTPSTQYQNTIASFLTFGGQMDSGIVKVSGEAFDVVLDHVELLGVTINAVVPINNNILLKDCFEDGNTTLSGDTTKVVRLLEGNEYEVDGITTDATLTRAFGVTLEPGQVSYMNAEVIGRQRNGTNKAIYDVRFGFFRAGSALAYINQTSNFTVGDIVTGGTSNATARIQADSDSGATGTLTLISIKGDFVNGETITDGLGGSATVSGALVSGNHSLDSVGITSVRTAYETDASWNVSVSASASEVAFEVTGAASQTIDWKIRAKKQVV